MLLQASLCIGPAEPLLLTHSKVESSVLGMYMGFPGSSAGKEHACNSGDPGSIPSLGSSPGEGIGYPLQYSRASFGAQKIKNLLEEGRATHSSILAWRIPWTEEPGSYNPCSHKVWDITERLSTHSTGYKRLQLQQIFLKSFPKWLQK